MKISLLLKLVFLGFITLGTFSNVVPAQMCIEGETAGQTCEVEWFNGELTGNAFCENWGGQAEPCTSIPSCTPIHGLPNPDCSSGGCNPCD